MTIVPTTPPVLLPPLLVGEAATTAEPGVNVPDGAGVGLRTVVEVVDVVVARVVVVVAFVAGGGTYETVGLVIVVGAGRVVVVVETAGRVVDVVVVVGDEEPPGSACALDRPASAGNRTATTNAAIRRPILKESAASAAP